MNLYQLLHLALGLWWCWTLYCMLGNVSAKEDKQQKTTKKMKNKKQNKIENNNNSNSYKIKNKKQGKQNQQWNSASGFFKPYFSYHIIRIVVTNISFSVWWEVTTSWKTCWWKTNQVFEKYHVEISLCLKRARLSHFNPLVPGFH